MFKLSVTGLGTEGSFRWESLNFLQESFSQKIIFEEMYRRQNFREKEGYKKEIVEEVKERFIREEVLTENLDTGGESVFRSQGRNRKERKNRIFNRNRHQGRQMFVRTG